MAALYRAQLDRFELDIETIADTDQKALAVHEYPFVDGADLDDMGMRARVTRYRCHFGNETYDLHTEFIEHVRGRGLLQLVHPVDGVRYGKVSSVTKSYDDTIDHVEVDIDLVEQRDGESVVAPEQRVVPVIEDRYLSAQAQQQGHFAALVREAIGAEAGGLLSKAIVVGSSVLSQATGLSGGARKWVADLDADIRLFEGVLTDVSNPGNTVLSLVSYGDDLPGRVIGAVAATVERYALAAKAVAQSPSAFIASFNAGIGSLKDSCEILSGTLTVGAAQYGAVAVAEMYSQDEDRRSLVRRAEKAKQWRADGTYVGEPAPAALYTVNELEVSLAAVRAAIQQAIEVLSPRGASQAAGTVEASALVASLKAMARDLQAHVNTIKLERERLITVNVTAPQPLHAVCLRYGLPHTVAERLVGINDIRNPNLVEGPLKIYARQD